LEFAFPLSRLWLLSGRYREGQELLEKCLALDRSSSDDVRARCIQRLGSIYWGQGNVGDAQSAYGEALSLFRKLGSTNDVAAALSNLGMTAAAIGDDDLAIRQFKLAFRLVKNTNPDRAREIRYNINGMLIEQGRYEEALVLTQKMVDEYFELGESGESIYALTTLAQLNLYVGDPNNSIKILRNTLSIAAEHAKESAIMFVALTLGECATALDKPDLAGNCLAILEQLDAESGHQFAGMDLERYLELCGRTNANPLAESSGDPCTDLETLANCLYEAAVALERA
jgi:tetratricopeptide (TPR) repeat protein